jgi:hypothetical protein
MTTQAIEEISNTQESIFASIDRMCWTLFETEHVGLETIDKLQSQREQTDRIQRGLDRVEWEQNKGKKMLGTLGSMQFRYGTHVAAKREVRNLETPKTPTTSKTNNQRSQEKPQVPSWKQTKRLTEPSSPRSATQHVDKLDPNHEFFDELSKIADTDDAIDHQLDTLGVQLDTIVQIARTVEENVSNQSADLNKLEDRSERVRTKQMVLNRRVRRFLQGKFRKQYKIQDSKHV